MPLPDLSGLGVVVTRPAQQADGLCALIEQAGGRALRFPVLEIAAPGDPGPLQAVIERLEQYDIAVFISPNAVERALNLIRARRGELPPSLQLATVGRGSARALRKMLGREPDICPRERFDSEALLALAPMQAVAGKRVVIFRGEGGRELLADTLRARGAEVTYAEVYRRTLPDADLNMLLRAWARNEVDIITVTSGEGLRNLFEMVGKLGRQWLRATPLVVVSERTAALAAELGFKQPAIVSATASDEALVASIAAWAAHKR